MGTLGRVVLGALVGSALLIMGCGGADEGQEESDVTSITMAEFESITTDETTREEVEQMLGPPASRDEVDFEGVEVTSGSEQDCVYYRGDGDSTTAFQLCFDGDGMLTSKSSVGG